MFEGYLTLKDKKEAEGKAEGGFCISDFCTLLVVFCSALSCFKSRGMLEGWG
jgi:hypothetical protein